MTQTWTKDGQRVPVTVVRVGPVVVTQVKTRDKDGYDALQIGFGSRKIKNITKPQLGHLKKAIEISKTSDQNPKKTIRYLREARGSGQSTNRDGQSLEIGDVVSATDVLFAGDIVKVIGTSKGKGFQGGVRRWGFHGGPRTHGQSDRERAPGSIGQTTTPGRVMRGKKMAGRMGGDRVTVKNLLVLSVTGDGSLMLSGPVPGPFGSLIYIEKMGHDDKFPGLAVKPGEVEEENVESGKEPSAGEGEGK